MNKKGFGLIGILIIIAVIAFLGGGGLYLNSVGQKKSQIQIGQTIEEKAREVANKVSQQNQDLSNSVLSSLPPDPGDAGKQTLAGIDSDGDGVRDDLQRYIALTYPNSARTRAALTQYSRSAQKTVLESLDKDRSISNIHGEISANRCLAYVLGDGVAAVPVYHELRARTLNTIERSRAYLVADRFMVGQVFTVSDDLKSFCSFNPETLPN